MRNNTYIIDSGHGGIDLKTGRYVTPGKRSPIWDDGSQYFEGVGNRLIAKVLAAQLREVGIKHEFTVSPDNSIDLSLSKRCQIANEIHGREQGKTVFISIHSNASEHEKAEGYEVFTSPGITKADQYAKIWLAKMAQTFPTHKNRGAKEARFYVLVRTLSPAILVETMFHTNERECKILQSHAGRNQIAQALFETIIEIENGTSE